MRHTPRRRRLFVSVLAICATAAVGALARQTPRNPPGNQTQAPGLGPHAPTGIVLGTVIDATTGRPIAVARVTIQYIGPVTAPVPDKTRAVGGPPSPTSAPRLVVTDADGTFLFRELDGGRYRVVAQAPGYTYGSYLQTRLDDNQIHYLDLPDHARLGDVQIRVWKFGAITGAVVDEAGEPAVGVTVKAWQRLGARRLLLIVGSGSTDDRGIYRIAGLRPGDYVVGITATVAAVPVDVAQANAAHASEIMINRLIDPLSRQPVLSGFRVGGLVVEASPLTSGYVLAPPADSGPLQVYETTFFPSAAAPSQATVVMLAAAEERTGVNLALTLVPASRISGTVTGPDGPAANIELRVLSPAGDDFDAPDSEDTDIASTLTDASGSFQLLGVPAGRYTLVVSKSPPPGPGRGAGPSPASPHSALWAYVPLTVGGADIRDLAVQLEPGSRVSGHVEFDGSTVKPTANQMELLAVGLESLSSGTSITPTRLLPDGQFTMAGYPPGRYIMAVRPVPQGWVVRSVALNGRNIADQPFDLQGGDLEGIVVTFTDRPATIGGSVTDSAGAPDTTADVIIFPADVQGWKEGAFNPSRTRRIVASTTGAYEFRNLPAGDYFVVAVKDSVAANLQDAQFLTGLARIASRVAVVEGDRKTLPLKTTAVR